MRNLDFLIRPIAHRGLHDRSSGIVENTLSAASAAVNAGYGIELDVQRAACGTPVVFHDRRLHRLTDARGRIADHSAVDLAKVEISGTADRIVSLAEVLRVIDGRVPVFIELKSDWRGLGGRRGLFFDHVARALHAYRGPVAVISLDPFCLRTLRETNPRVPRGLIVGGKPMRYAMPIRRAWVRSLMHYGLARIIARANFVARDVRTLSSQCHFTRFTLYRLPVVAWTVRSEETLRTARRYADGIIFERPVMP